MFPRLGRCAASCLLLLAAASAPAAEAKPATYTFQSSRAVGSVEHVEATLEMGGDLKIVENKVEKTVKTAATGTLSYDERIVQAGAHPRSVRCYQKAEAAIGSGQDTMRPVLRPQRSLIVAEASLPQITLFSPSGPLTRDELDLIDLLGNSLLLDRLLPERAVAIGETWRLPNELVTALLGLDAVADSDVSGKLTEVADGQARFELDGRVEGAYRGASTRIEVKAKYRFDQAQARVAWLGLLVKENRAVGFVEGGLDVTAKYQLRAAPAPMPPQLADAALAGLTLAASPASTLLSYASERNGWQFDYDRRWFLMTNDRDDRTLLRLIDRGNYVAECQVTALPAAAPDRLPSLNQFQADVERGLGKSFKRFVEVGEGTNGPGHRICRVLAEGESSGLSIRWAYYLVSDKQGHQAVFAFTVQSTLVQTLGDAAERLVGAVQLIAPQPPGK